MTDEPQSPEQKPSTVPPGVGNGKVSFRETLQNWEYLARSDKLVWSDKSLLPEPDPNHLTEAELDRRRRHGYRLAAQEVLRTARWLLQEKLKSLGREDLFVPHDPPHDAKILEELVAGYFVGRMGDREQVRLAHRRLAEGMLRHCIPRYSARRDPDAVGYYTTVYKDLFAALDLTRSSLTLVDGNLYAALQRRQQFSQI